jgi:hypothetical protein
MPSTRAEIISDLTSRIKVKSRFDKADNSIDKITPKEYEIAIDSALDLINEYAPLTTFTLEQIYADTYLLTSLRRLLVDFAIRECVFTLAMDWLANSEESETIEQFTISSKYSQYRDLYDALWSSNEDKLASVKKSVGGCML